MIIKFKKPAVFIPLLLFMAIVIYKLIQSPAPPFTDTKVVEVLTIKPSTIQKNVDVIGTARPLRNATLRANIKGILQTKILSGEVVKQSTVVAVIENKDASKNLEAAKDRLSIAASQLKTYKDLYNKGVISKSALEEKKQAMLEAEQVLANAKLGDINLTAPFDGTLGVFKINSGSEVVPGDVIVNVYDASSLNFCFDLSPQLLKGVDTKNIKAVVEGNEYKVSNVQNMVDSETQMCPAEANITGSLVIPGSTINATVVLLKKENVIVVPYGAVFVDGGQTFVYTAKDGKANLTKVSVGIRDKTNLEITDGLKIGDKLIYKGCLRLYPDVAIKIAPEENSDNQDKTKKAGNK